MSDDIKKLVERLRATFFEVRDFSLHDVRDAANALEAMAVNRDLWRDKCVLMETERDQMLIDLEEYRRDVADLTAERDRLKAALERARAIATLVLEGAAAATIEALRAERDRLKDEVERLRNEKAVVGAGSQIIGKGADQFIIDDPFGPPTEPAPAVCEWASIETAPKDGALICGAWMHGRRWETRALHWNGHDWECPTEDWYYDPTHWMPLPPPEAKE